MDSIQAAKLLFIIIHTTTKCQQNVYRDQMRIKWKQQSKQFSTQHYQWYLFVPILKTKVPFQQKIQGNDKGRSIEKCENK